MALYMGVHVPRPITRGLQKRGVAVLTPRLKVDSPMSNVYVSQMKLLTMREFFHSPTLTKSLHPGQTLLVTSRGKPDLVVTKAGRRRKMTAAELRREARALLLRPGRKVDTVALLRKLRQ